MSKEVLPSVRAVQVDERWVVLHEESRARMSFCTLFMRPRPVEKGMSASVTFHCWRLWAGLLRSLLGRESDTGNRRGVCSSRRTVGIRQSYREP